jgi:hypothetical protein
MEQIALFPRPTLPEGELDVIAFIERVDVAARLLSLVSRTESETFERTSHPLHRPLRLFPEKRPPSKPVQRHAMLPIQFNCCSSFIAGYFRTRKSQRGIERGTPGGEMSEQTTRSSAVIND